MNWRSIAEVGMPTDTNATYLVTDRKEVATTQIDRRHRRKPEGGYDSFMMWVGDENTWEDNQCCSGDRQFDLVPTHWMPVNEIQLPE